MNTSEIETLVVESNFSSRKEIVSALVEGQLPGRIREALSLDDGLRLIERGTIDACILGPALTLDRKVEFLRAKSKLPLTKPCAVIAIAEDDQDESLLASLTIAGADATCGKKTPHKRFTEIVQSATLRARESKGIGADLRSMVERSFVSSTLSERRAYDSAALAQVLDELSNRLLGLADDFSHGRLKLSANGKPSLAGQDALRLAFESAFPSNASVEAIGTADNFFVTVLVEWLVERTQVSAREATESLRAKLISFATASSN
ncbi:MAG: hypothetical protein U0136_05875 [Bdellovibrionota bacterium]